MPTHSGYVAIAGRPNVGKSTLLNALVGQKISITSRKPQTTRHSLLGIKTLETGQLVYVDTPGLQAVTQKAINRHMNKAALSSFEGVDLVLFVVEAMQWRDEDDFVLQQLARCRAPLLLVVNKADRVQPRSDLLPYLQKVAAKRDFMEICPVSALSGDNVDALERSIFGHMPIGDFIYPEDQLTDRSERFLAAELIREKLMRRLGEELPYQINVEIEQFKEETGLLRISAVIWVERPGQKAIVIGKQGAMLKKVGTDARRDMEILFDNKVFLQLWVKVKEGWSDNESALRHFGYAP